MGLRPTTAPEFALNLEKREIAESLIERFPLVAVSPAVRKFRDPEDSSAKLPHRRPTSSFDLAARKPGQWAGPFTSDAGHKRFRRTPAILQY
jgi:hypothetical protein